MFRLIRARAKQLGGQDSNDQSEVDITPLLDVVFIMLIFFIVTASFVKESGIGLNKPSSSHAEAPDTPPIVVEISSNNVISIQRHEVAAAAIKATITRLRAESPNASVVVRLDPKATTAAMIAAVDSIRAANVEYPSIGLLKS